MTSSHSGRSRVSAAESLWLASIRRERGDAFCFSAPFYGDEVLRRARRVAAAAGTSALGPFGDETQTGTETNDLRTTFDKDASLSASEALAAMALRECPDSGALWAERVASAPRPQRKSRSVDALKRCGDDARVVAAVARLFWLDRKVDKARAWFQRATTLDPSDGDHWASLYAFEKRFGGESRVAAAREACVAAAPNRGDFWCAARKDPKMWHDPVEKTLERVAELVRGGGGEVMMVIVNAKTVFRSLCHPTRLGAGCPLARSKENQGNNDASHQTWTGAVSGAGARQGEIPAWRVGARRWHRSARALALALVLALGAWRGGLDHAGDAHGFGPGSGSLAEPRSFARVPPYLRSGGAPARRRAGVRVRGEASPPGRPARTHRERHDAKARVSRERPPDRPHLSSSPRGRRLGRRAARPRVRASDQPRRRASGASGCHGHVPRVA